MKTNKNFDYWLLFLWNIPAFFLAINFGIDYIISAIIIAGIPAMYLTFRKPGLFYKISITSLIFGIFGAGTVSYLGHLDGSWYEPSLFPRVLGVYPVEDFIWAFIYFYYMLSFYEYFYEKETLLKFPKHFKKHAKRLLILTSIFSVCAYLIPHLLVIPYFYAAFILFCICIMIVGLSRHPNLFSKVIKTNLFFIIPHAVGEYVATINHNWWFPGKHFIGYVSIAGITIPLEEFLWILLLVPTAIIVYEIIADDRI